MGLFGKPVNVFAPGQYDTRLSTAEEAAFLAWAKRTGRLADLADYDMRGAWKSGASQADNGHFPDTYKKPNHPTFSVESQYSGPDATGGQWVPAPNGDGWTFFASPDNLRSQSPGALENYFREREPGSRVVLPANGLLNQLFPPRRK
jgi:hypothetical protein